VTARPEATQGGAWVSETRQHRKALTSLSWDAAALWRQLRGYSADIGSDGRITVRKLHVAVDRKISVKRVEAIVGELVDEGLITRDGDDLVLDWSDQPSAEVWNDPVKRERWARARRLGRDSELTKRIKERDRNLCRYDGVRVNWSDKVSPIGGTYDHVDPDGDNSFENVVVACRRCNGRKRDRTPEQAGMTLLKPGTTAEQAISLARGPTPGQPPADPGPARPVASRARPDTANPGPTPGQPPTDQRPAAHLRAVGDEP
jgi:hypothetical protein